MSLIDFDRVTNAMEVSSEGNEPAEVHLDLTSPPNADANVSTAVTPEDLTLRNPIYQGEIRLEVVVSEIPSIGCRMARLTDWEEFRSYRCWQKLLG
ncbi:hypothetical protein CEXT_557901 [Caerostris extrusa]|uniref:Uncharacterized protein n=1 Tax=Caerostris extrusa TaxID=172846 RepID=A0AAV4PX98_CAEEX|nr:hypothetical protein CEXT_557901 [Caerostris extrusa]